MANLEQQWEPVILRKQKPAVHHQRAPDAKVVDNLMSDETVAPALVGIETGRKLEQARSALKLTRVQLAKQLNLQESVIRDHEQGTAVLNKQLLNRIARALKLKL